jgi:hypothetical protein
VGLLDDIENQHVRKGPLCTVGTTLDKLAGKDQTDLIAALNRADIQGTVIAKVLMDRGFAVRPEAVSRHRRRLCNCEPR